MVRFVAFLILVLAVSTPLPGVGSAVATTAQPYEQGVSPRTLERRARDAEPDRKAELLRLAARR